MYSYNAALKAARFLPDKHERSQRASSILEDMARHDVQPNAQTVTSGVQCYKGNLTLAEEFFETMSQKIAPTTTTYTGTSCVLLK